LKHVGFDKCTLKEKDMPVSVTELKKVIETRCAEEVRVVENCMVLFGFKCGKYFAHITLRLCRQFPDLSEPQAIGVSFVFASSERKEYTVDHLDPGLVGQFCVDQQIGLEWASLEIQAEPDGSQILVLYRMIGTSTKDLKLARQRDFSSQLHTALLHLTEEFNRTILNVVEFASVEQDELDRLLILQHMPDNSPEM
jgi:hypothetical protein